MWTLCGTSTEAGEGFICVPVCGVKGIGWCVCWGGGLNERCISYVLRRIHNLKRETLGIIDLRWTIKKYPGWLPNFGAPLIGFSAISYHSHIILVFAVLQTLRTGRRIRDLRYLTDLVLTPALLSQDPPPLLCLLALFFKPTPFHKVRLPPPPPPIGRAVPS